MSRKGGQGAYDEDDWRDDDDLSDDDYSDDDGFDAYDRSGGGATFSAKNGKKKQPAPPPPKATRKLPETKKPPAASEAVAAAKPRSEIASRKAATAPIAAGAPEKPRPLHLPSDAAPPLAGLSLSDAAAAAAAAPPPYSHSKELAAALSARANAETAKSASGELETRNKPEVHVVVLGHVDAGKSTLVGRLLLDCGAVDAREAAKVAAAAARAGKGSFSWAWLLDATDDERQRGVTVEVGRCRIATPKLHVTLLDAPGHADFVPEAIGGVVVADAALLVVDGSRGGFESGFERGSCSGNGGASSCSSSSTSAAASGGQTKEHAALARALGVRELIVAVTKLDTLDYNRDRFEEIKARLGAFLGSLGFGASPSNSSSSPPSRRVTWLPVSAPAGQNVSCPPTDPCLRSWWGGGITCTLLAALGALSPPDRSAASALRLPLADVAARPPRAGQPCAVVSGKVEAGALAPGMEVVAVPPGGGAGSGRVVSVVVHGGGGGNGAAAAAAAAGTAAASSSSASAAAAAAAVAVAGDSCEVVVSGPLAESGVLGRGAVLCPASHPVALAKKFVARIKVLDGASGGGGGGAFAAAAFVPPPFSLSPSPGAAGIILPGSSVTLHVGTAVRPATITRLVALLDPKTGEEVRRRPRLVGRGEAALVEVAPDAGDAVAVVAAAAVGDNSASSTSSSSSAPERLSTLSRIALREAGKTLAVGVVVEVVE